MNKFRKPYVSCMLALLVLFISCQPQTSDIENLSSEEQVIFNKNANQNGQLTIESFVTNHISIITSYLLNPSDYNITSFSLVTELEQYVNYDLLVFELQANNIENAEEFANMYLEVQKNTNLFLNNYHFGKLSFKEIDNLISYEITKQLKDLNVYSEHPTCGERFQLAKFRCERNFFASVAAISLSTFWSFGVGTVIGASVAGGIFLNCGIEAMSDFRACIAQ